MKQVSAELLTLQGEPRSFLRPAPSEHCTANTAFNIGTTTLPSLAHQTASPANKTAHQRTPLPSCPGNVNINRA